MTRLGGYQDLDQLHIEMGKLAYKLLKDGQWHPREPIVKELMKLVPPGIGTRRAERMRSDAGRGPAKRLVNRTPGEIVQIGARDVVREFLSNRITFEYDKTYKPGARPAGFVDDRQIRMLVPPRAVRGLGIPGGPKARVNLLEYEVEHLRDQVALLRAELIGLGKEDRANEIAPLPPSEVDD